MSWKDIQIVLLLSLLLFTLMSIVNGQTTSKDCSPAKTCSDCLRADGECYWCEDADYTSGSNVRRARCDLRSELLKQQCKKIGIKDGNQIPTENLPFDSFIQVRPQKVTVTLRPAQTQEVRVFVQPAKDYPVKLYYLMDLSKSMYDDLQNLKTLGTKIAKTIKNITANYKLAFGTFVDKTVAPFIQPELLDRPCAYTDDNNNTQNCVKTFSYHHIFDFDGDATAFENKVKEQKISGNLDTPEGGFDALMQLAACPTQLKWGSTKESRRLAVFVTDASPHIGGDGKIGGIVTPNDEQCYLTTGTTDGTLQYGNADKMDYPSISSLKAVLRDAKIIPIFAVTKDVKAVYQNLVTEWEHLLAKAGDLETDSSNIVTLIRDAYNQIVSTARLTHDTKDFTVTYKLVDSTCPTKVKDNECTDMVTGKAVEFIVDITAKKCPDNWKDDKKFLINIPGFSEVEITVKMICDCECETDSSLIEKNSKTCNGTGAFACGICNCPIGRFGTQCQCDSAEQADQSLCRRNSTQGELESVCSGQGACICGECVCNKRDDPTQIISGRYCECDNWNCPRFNGEVCGGPSRGVCECGRCVCNDAYLGINCGSANCTIGALKCLRDGLVCSGNGNCDCDRCVCETGYRGTHCETCVSCESKCKDNKDCVLCQVFNEPSKEVCDKVPKCNIEIVNKTEEQCAFKDDNDCYVIFSFSQDVAANETIKVQREKRCIVVVKKDPNILVIVLGTIGGIVLLCLILLLLWKLLITAYDNYEYHKFEKDRMKSKWENAENPIYRPSKQQFQNPTFAGTK